jgi:hypothetical protein
MFNQHGASLLLFFTLLSLSQSSSYFIGDARYDVGYCNISSLYKIRNQFGKVTITNDIIATKLTFQVEWVNNTVYPSCFLCQYSRVYCLPSSYSSHASQQQTDISMAKGFMYNFMVVAVKENEEFPRNIPLSSRSYQFSMGANNTITLDISKISSSLIRCGDVIKLVIIPLVSLYVPYKMDVITIVYQNDGGGGGDDSTQFIECKDESSRIYDGLGCSVIKRAYYITYTLSNCLSTTLVSQIKDNDTVITDGPSFTALAWYIKIVDFIYTHDTDGNLKRLLSQMNDDDDSGSGKRFEMVNGETSTLDTLALLIIQKMGNMNVCGRMWYDILLNSRIEQMKCNEVAMLYFDMKPLVRLALQTVTVHLNMIIKEGKTSDKRLFNDLLIAHDVLDRHCLHLNDEYRRNETVYDSLITRFEVFNGEFDENTMAICAFLMRYAATPVNGTNDKSGGKGQPPLPYPIYLYQYPTWYFQTLSYFILYYSNDMALGSIFLLSFIILCFVFATVALLWTCRIGYLSHKSHRYGTNFINKEE